MHHPVLDVTFISLRIDLPAIRRECGEIMPMVVPSAPSVRAEPTNFSAHAEWVALQPSYTPYDTWSPPIYGVS